MNELSPGLATSWTPEPLAVSPSEAARLSGVGRTKLYEALGSGALRSLKIGSRRLITIEALKDWLSEAERTTSVEDGHAS